MWVLVAKTGVRDLPSKKVDRKAIAVNARSETFPALNLLIFLRTGVW
jgi:hypothetical protein